MSRRWRVGLWLLLAMAVYVRVSHASVGLPYLFRWDEPLVVNSGLWALGHGWDPFTFRYGSLPIYLSASASAVAYLVEMASGSVSSFAQFVDAGPPINNVVGLATNAPLAFWYSRILFIVIGVCGLGLTYTAAREAGASPRAAFLAALAVAVSPIHIRTTLLAIVDGIGLTLVAATLVASLRFLRREEHSRRALVSAGITSGLAVATKFALLWTPLIPLVALLLGRRAWRDRLTKDLCVLGAAALAAFIVAQPYALIEPGRYLSGVGFEVSHYSFLGHVGQEGSSAGFAQFTLVREALAQGFGTRWPSLVVLLLSGIGIVTMVARNWRVAALLAGGIVWQILFLTQQVVFFDRGLLPVLPVFAILAAIGADTLTGFWPRREGAPESRLRVVVVSALIFVAFIPVMLTQLKEARETWPLRDTRSLATDWLVEHVKPGQDVVISNQLPFDLTELRKARIAARVVDPLAFPCWFANDPYVYYITSNERGPFREAAVQASFEGRAVTTDEPLYSPQVSILGRTPGQCDVVSSPTPATDAKTILPEIGGSGYDPSPRFRGLDYWLLGYDGWVKYPNMTAGEGLLTVQVDARATQASKVPAYALVKVKRADNVLVGWHFMPIDETRSVKEITFRVAAGEYFVLVSQPYSLEHGLTEPYLVELHGVRVRTSGAAAAR